MIWEQDQLCFDAGDAMPFDWRQEVVNDHAIVAEHTRGVGKQDYHVEPWHYVPWRWEWH